MARQLIDLPRMNAEDLEDDDLLLVRDVSARKDKRVRKSDLIKEVDIDAILPVGVTLESSAQIDTSKMLGTWTLESSYNELQTVELHREYVTSGATSYDYEFGEIDWADDIEIDIQLESSTAGGVGIGFNDRPSSMRSQTVSNPSNTPTTGTVEDNWVAYHNLAAFVSSQIIIRCISAPENSVNYRRIWIDARGHAQHRYMSGSLKSAAKLKKLNLVFENGAKANRMLVVVTAKKRMGKVYRYRRTA